MRVGILGSGLMGRKLGTRLVGGFLLVAWYDLRMPQRGIPQS
jgi:3-hydroxyisobutyrate dehydrogenase-like beta-hydroxyacid dehydrogenase